MKNHFDPMYLIDAYKLDHRRMYPAGTERVYSNLTPRSSRLPGVNKIVFFGLQAFLQRVLGDMFSEWFAEDENIVCERYERRTLEVLGPNNVGSSHIRALHQLGYLPLRFCALPEGTEVPLRIPIFTVENTRPEFFWLTNYIETMLSAETWLPSTSATIALRMRRLIAEAAARTSDQPGFVDWQAHDFSFRGLSSIESAASSGAGHLLSFAGTDSLCSLDWIDAYYPRSDQHRGQAIGGSVAATEHSVMCAGSKDGELNTFARLLRLYPTGIVSVVSDTWDLWEVLCNYLPALKSEILARDGKLVIRPDSGDPVEILCGDADAPAGSPAHLGVINILWNVFGGTINSKGYRQLDSHIGAIYGDSISYDRANDIVQRLANLGFASTNVVLGIGSYTYQYNTRDTLGFAMKATWAQINGVGCDLYKDPITDNGVKRSAKGRLAVQKDADGELFLIEQATPAQEATSLLQPVWEDGKLLVTRTWDEVVARLGVRGGA